MQVESSRLWSPSEPAPFVLDPALSSYRSSSSSSSFQMQSDERSPHYHRSFPDHQEHTYPNLNHSQSPSASSSSYTSSASFDNISRYPPVRSHSLTTSAKILSRDGRASPSRQMMPPPGLYTHPSQIQDSPPSPDGGRPSSSHSQFSSLPSMPRLPPILQVEKQQVTTSATQAASASRRRNEAHFMCPVPGCGSTFTRRFNLRGDTRAPFA
jgi:hypothetical protein